MQCEYQSIQEVSQSDRKNGGREWELWESKKMCNWEGDIVIFGSISTHHRLDGESSHEPLDRLTAHRESESEQEEVTQHSRPKESARLLRQLKQDDPDPPPNL